MVLSVGDIPGMPVPRAVRTRHRVCDFDADRTVGEWRIQAITRPARFASCQGNINATGAIVVLSGHPRAGVHTAVLSRSLIR